MLGSSNPVFRSSLGVSDSDHPQSRFTNNIRDIVGKDVEVHPAIDAASHWAYVRMFYKPEKGAIYLIFES